MRKFIGHVSTWKVGSECTFEFEAEDDITEEEIEKAAFEALCDSGMMEWWYEEEK